ncbi:MAG TPA: phasin family protein [Stellaceae bacterium]|nr:phasin family protein [Stellaceae bacterium]
MDSKGKRGPRALPPAAVAAAENISAAPEPAAAAAAREAVVADFAREAYEALAQSQQVMARGFEALGLEIARAARSGIDRAAKTASEMLAVKTLSDAIEVSAGLARDSFDTLVEGSTRLSDLGIKFAREAGQPLLAQWQRDWVKAFCPGL